MLRKALILALIATPALAEGDYVPPVTDPLTLKECSACHIAFPASFLPAQSWQALMANLSDHFGEDASLPEADARAIETWLVANAATGRAARNVDPANPPLRITELSWFRKEHDGEVSAAAKAKAGTMANCAACHKGAANGIFEDD